MRSILFFLLSILITLTNVTAYAQSNTLAIMKNRLESSLIQLQQYLRNNDLDALSNLAPETFFKNSAHHYHIFETIVFYGFKKALKSHLAISEGAVITIDKNNVKIIKLKDDDIYAIIPVIKKQQNEVIKTFFFGFVENGEWRYIYFNPLEQKQRERLESLYPIFKQVKHLKDQLISKP